MYAPVKVRVRLLLFGLSCGCLRHFFSASLPRKSRPKRLHLDSPLIHSDEPPVGRKRLFPCARASRLPQTTVYLGIVSSRGLEWLLPEKRDVLRFLAGRACGQRPPCAVCCWAAMQMPAASEIQDELDRPWPVNLTISPTSGEDFGPQHAVKRAQIEHPTPDPSRETRH